MHFDLSSAPIDFTCLIIIIDYWHQIRKYCIQFQCVHFTHSLCSLPYPRLHTLLSLTLLSTPSPQSDLWQNGQKLWRIRWLQGTHWLDDLRTGQVFIERRQNPIQTNEHWSIGQYRFLQISTQQLRFWWFVLEAICFFWHLFICRLANLLYIYIKQKNVTIHHLVDFSANELEDESNKEDIAKDKRRWQMADTDGDNQLNLEQFRGFLHPEDSPSMHNVVVQVSHAYARCLPRLCTSIHAPSPAPTPTPASTPTHPYILHMPTSSAYNILISYCTNTALRFPTYV